MPHVGFIMIIKIKLECNSLFEKILIERWLENTKSPNKRKDERGQIMLASHKIEERSRSVKKANFFVCRICARFVPTFYKKCVKRSINAYKKILSYFIDYFIIVA